MSRVTRTALVPYTALQMYELVSDVESYSGFLPGCIRSSVLKDEGEWIEAALELSKGGITQSFTTRNRMVCGETIEMQLLEGPFKYLHGTWNFRPLGDEGCKVSLDLEFEMSNALFQMTLGSVFEQMTGSMVDAFSRRAKQIYG